MIKEKNGENVLYLENAAVVLVYCNIFSNNYQQTSTVLYAFVPNKLFGQLLDISPKTLTFLKTFTKELLYVKV